MLRRYGRKTVVIIMLIITIAERLEDRTEEVRQSIHSAAGPEY